MCDSLSAGAVSHDTVRPIQFLSRVFSPVASQASFFLPGEALVLELAPLRRLRAGLLRLRFACCDAGARLMHIVSWKRATVAYLVF